MSADITFLQNLATRGMNAQQAADDALIRHGRQCRSCGSRNVELGGSESHPAVLCEDCTDQYDLVDAL